MHYCNVALATIALFCGNTLATAEDPPAFCLRNLQQEIVELINDFVQSDNQTGIDYVATRRTFTQCMFKSVNYTAPQCENKQLPAAANNTDQIIQYLQQSQLGLSIVSRDLLENNKDLKTDLCKAFRPYRVVACYNKKGYFENMTDIFPDAKQNCPNAKGSAEVNLRPDDEPRKPREDPQPLIKQVQLDINNVINDFAQSNISNALTDYVSTRKYFVDRLWRSLWYHPAACRNMRQTAPNNTEQVIKSLQEVQLKLAVISRDVLNGDEARPHLCDAWGPWQAVACYEGKGFRDNVTAVFEDVVRWCPPREDPGAAIEEHVGMQQKLGDVVKEWL